MPEKLRNEAEGILAWAVEGCRLWRAEGLEIPPAVKKATEGYRGEMDVIAQFVADCCEVGEGLQAPGKELYQAYDGWCSQNGENLIIRRQFTKRLKEMGFEDDRIGPERKRGLKGLRLCSG